MTKRKNARPIAETVKVSEDVSAHTQQHNKTVTVRYTGKGKCLIIKHLFDPDLSQSLVKEVPVDVYENKLKPLGCFEIVL